MPEQFIPDVWRDAILAERSRLSFVLNTARAYARRGHYRRLPRWALRHLPRRWTWVWDETEAEHRTRLAALPPLRFPIIRDTDT